MWPGIPDTYQNLPESDSGSFRYTRSRDYQTPTRHALLGHRKRTLRYTKSLCWQLLILWNNNNDVRCGSWKTPVQSFCYNSDKTRWFSESFYSLISKEMLHVSITQITTRLSLLRSQLIWFCEKLNRTRRHLYNYKVVNVKRRAPLVQCWSVASFRHRLTLWGQTSASHATHCLPTRDGQAELAWVAGCILRWFASPKTVTPPSTNRARRTVTSLMKTSALPMSQTTHTYLWHRPQQLLLHLFNGLFSRTTWVSRHQKGKPFWILLEQEMMGWQWHQLDDHMQTICTSLQTDNHTSTSPHMPQQILQ